MSQYNTIEHGLERWRGGKTPIPKAYPKLHPWKPAKRTLDDVIAHYREVGQESAEKVVGRPMLDADWSIDATDWHIALMHRGAATGPLVGQKAPTWSHRVMIHEAARFRQACAFVKPHCNPRSLACRLTVSAERCELWGECAEGFAGRVRFSPSECTSVGRGDVETCLSLKYLEPAIYRDGQELWIAVDQIHVITLSDDWRLYVMPMRI